MVPAIDDRESRAAQPTYRRARSGSRARLAAALCATLACTSAVASEQPPTRDEVTRECAPTPAKTRAWLADEIYPRMTRDIPHIIARGWARGVNGDDLFHAHVYIRGAYAVEGYRPSVADARGEGRDRLTILYHSNESLIGPDAHKDRNIFSAPDGQLEAHSDIQTTIGDDLMDFFDGWDSTVPRPDPTKPRYRARALEGFGIAHPYFATSEQELLALHPRDMDPTSVVQVGPYWFGTFCVWPER